MTPEGTRFRLLRGVAAELDGREIALGPPSERLLLAILLEAGGALLTVDQIVDRLWPPKKIPRTARGLVHEYVKKVRRRLAAAGADTLIPRGAGGYRADTPGENVDLHRFHDRLRQARGTADPRTAIARYRDALAEWGPAPRSGDEALTGLPGAWADLTRQALAEDHRAARIACLELELELGEHHRVIPELYRAAEHGPVDEKLTELLMLALYRAGRTTDAREVFERAELRLETEIEAPPGLALSDLHRRIQWDDPSLRPPAPPPGVKMTEDVTALAADAAELVAEASRPGGVSVPAVGRLVEYFEGRLVGPDERAALAWARKSPDDPEAVTALAARLLRHLAEDAELARRVARLVEQASPVRNGRAEIQAETIEKLAVFRKNVYISGDMNL